MKPVGAFKGFAVAVMVVAAAALESLAGTVVPYTNEMQAAQQDALSMEGTLTGYYGTQAGFEKNVQLPLMSDPVVNPLYNLEGTVSTDASMSCRQIPGYMDVQLTDDGSGAFSAGITISSLDLIGGVYLHDTLNTASLDPLPYPIDSVCAGGIITCDGPARTYCRYYKWESTSSAVGFTPFVKATGTVNPAGVGEPCICISSGCADPATGLSIAKQDPKMVVDTIAMGVLSVISGTTGIAIQKMNYNVGNTHLVMDVSVSGKDCNILNGSLLEPGVNFIMGTYDPNDIGGSFSALTAAGDTEKINAAADVSSVYYGVTNSADATAKTQRICSIENMLTWVTNSRVVGAAGQFVFSNAIPGACYTWNMNAITLGGHGRSDYLAVATIFPDVAGMCRDPNGNLIFVPNSPGGTDFAVNYVTGMAPTYHWAGGVNILGYTQPSACAGCHAADMSSGYVITVSDFQAINDTTPCLGKIYSEGSSAVCYYDVPSVVTNDSCAGLNVDGCELKDRIVCNYDHVECYYQVKDKVYNPNPIVAGAGSVPGGGVQGPLTELCDTVQGSVSSFDVCADGTEVRVSTDGGVTWVPTVTDPPNAWFWVQEVWECDTHSETPDVSRGEAVVSSTDSDPSSSSYLQYTNDPAYAGAHDVDIPALTGGRDCIHSCVVKSKDSYSFTSTQNAIDTDVVDAAIGQGKISTEIRECTMDQGTGEYTVCPVSGSETVSVGCDCLDQLGVAAAQVGVLEEIRKDIQCTNYGGP